VRRRRKTLFGENAVSWRRVPEYDAGEWHLKSVCLVLGSGRRFEQRSIIIIDTSVVTFDVQVIIKQRPRTAPATIGNRCLLLGIGLLCAFVSLIFGLLVFLNARSKTSELHAAVAWLATTTAFGSLYLLVLKVARYQRENADNGPISAADQAVLLTKGDYTYSSPSSEVVSNVTAFFVVLIVLDVLIAIVIWLSLMHGKPLRHRAIFIGMTVFFSMTAHLGYMFKTITTFLDTNLVRIPTLPPPNTQPDRDVEVFFESNPGNPEDNS
jgi:hypothetical protein